MQAWMQFVILIESCAACFYFCFQNCVKKNTSSILYGGVWFVSWLFAKENFPFTFSFCFDQWFCFACFIYCEIVRMQRKCAVHLIFCVAFVYNCYKLVHMCYSLNCQYSLSWLCFMHTRILFYAHEWIYSSPLIFSAAMHYISIHYFVCGMCANRFISLNRFNACGAKLNIWRLQWHYNQLKHYINFVSQFRTRQKPYAINRDLHDDDDDYVVDRHWGRIMFPTLFYQDSSLDLYD